MRFVEDAELELGVAQGEAIAVDEAGTVLTGDQILAICANVMKKEGGLTNNMVVRTVMSNIGLSVALQSLRIDSVMTRV